MWLPMQGSSGRGDAMVMVPWEMWRAYGDRDVLAELWPHMTAWVDFAADAARSRRHPTGWLPGPSRSPTRPSCGTVATTGASGSRQGWWRRPPDPGPRVRRHGLPPPLGPVAGPHRAPPRARGRRGPLRGSGRPGAQRLAYRIHRCRRRLEPRHPGEPRARPGLRPGARGAAGPDGERLVAVVHEAGTHLGTVSWRRPTCCPCWPRRATSTWPSSSCSRTPRPPGCSWSTGEPPRCGSSGSVDGDGVPSRIAQPLQQGRRRLVPAPLRGRHRVARRRSGLPALPGPAADRRRAHLGRSGARFALRTHRVPRGASRAPRCA